MSNSNIAYKIVSEDYRSPYIDKEHPGSTYYKSKSWITPRLKDTPIFLHNDLKMAQKHKRDGERILKVKYEKYEEKHSFMFDLITLNISQEEKIVNLWKNGSIKESIWSLDKTPSYAILAKAVFVLDEL